MRKWATSFFLVVLVAGCTESQPNPLIGRWNSGGTGTSIKLEEGGECRYYQNSAGGLLCEWEPTGEGEALIVVKKNATFVEGTLRLVGDSLFFKTPSGGFDMFEK